MEKLSITQPLGHPSECREKMTEYVDLTEYKELRLVAYTNTPVDLYIIHSLDGFNKGITDRYKLVSGCWRSEKFECKMKYVALEVINVSDVPNTNLVCSVNGVHRRSSISHDVGRTMSQEKNEDHLEKSSTHNNDKEERKSKSPFRKFVHFKKSTPVGSPQNDRLPNLILEGALLTGSKFNKFELLPRGNPYEVLMIGKDGFPTWVPLCEMIKIYLYLNEQESKTEAEEVTTIPDGWTN